MVLWFMSFELTEALIDDILFSMEDQEGEFFLDTVEGVVCGGLEANDRFDDKAEAESGRYISLPEWDSSSGFRLMERFSVTLRNPFIREELGAALGRGRGVFRAFKDTLSRHPEAEKLWFAYKEREMKREIINWYNGLREEWGLEKIGMEPEETGDLVLEDFRFRPLQAQDKTQTGELHSSCQEEHRQVLAEDGAGFSAAALLNEAEAFEAKSSEETSKREDGIGFVAEAGGDVFAGYVSGVIRDSSLFIQRLEIKREFRGLGLGETLLVRFLESLDSNEVSQVFLDIPSWAEGFSRVLLRESFKPYVMRYWLKLKDRAD